MPTLCHKLLPINVIGVALLLPASDRCVLPDAPATNGDGSARQPVRLLGLAGPSFAGEEATLMAAMLPSISLTEATPKAAHIAALRCDPNDGPFGRERSRTTEPLPSPKQPRQTTPFGQVYLGSRAASLVPYASLQEGRRLSTRRRPQLRASPDHPCGRCLPAQVQEAPCRGSSA